MQRSVFLLNLDELEAPLLLDVYRVKGEGEHQYDYSHQYDGQIIRTNFDYQNHAELHPLAQSNGYQHLWNVASGEAQGTVLISWLQNHTFYTWFGASTNHNNEVIFTRTGASDPNFNLRSEPAFILRNKGQSSLFVSALETHGYFNEEFEQSTNARGQVTCIDVVGYNEIGSIVVITTKKSQVTVMISNRPDADEQTHHQVELNGKTLSWQGYYAFEVIALDLEKQ